MKDSVVTVSPVERPILADKSMLASLAKLAAEWESTGEFWSFTSCIETMSKIPHFLSSAAMHQDNRSWIGWYLASCHADSCELLYIYAAKSARGKGIGRQLLEDLIRRAAEESKVDAISLEVRPSNKAAIRLYESKGFKKISCRKRYYSNGDDALVYQRTFIRN